MEINYKGTLEGDLRLVQEISRGNARAWEEFVGRYTGWALYRAARWCQHHCGHRTAGLACGIRAVSLRYDGKEPYTGGNGDECDEGMDTYIWIMEQLKRKAMRFGGRNGSRLSTYVWRVLNSKELYVDWLRWKYGRVF